MLMPTAKKNKPPEIKFHGFVLGGKMYQILNGNFDEQILTVILVLVCLERPFNMKEPEPFKMQNPVKSGATRFSFFKEIKTYK